MSRAVIYKFYEYLGKDKEGTKDETKLYRCLKCKEVKKARTTSNLITHLELASGHEEVLNQYLTENGKLNSPNVLAQSKSAKRLRFDSPLASPSSSLDNSIVRFSKYSRDSKVQKDRVNYLLEMLVKCMLPLSLVENDFFSTYLNKIDPAFNVPTVKTIQRSK